MWIVEVCGLLEGINSLLEVVLKSMPVHHEFLPVFLHHLIGRIVKILVYDIGARIFAL